MSAQSDKATQVHMVFVNKTGQALNLTAATHSGNNTHWETQAPPTVAAGATGNASAYSAGNCQIDLTYTGADDSAVFRLQGITPLIGDNSASGSSSSDSYTVPASAGSGYNPTDTYTIEPGGTFSYTGHPEEYTVPVGITQLKIQAVGGGTFNIGTAAFGTGGANVAGIATVTPGQVLTVAVASSGSVPSKYAGGWGMTLNGNNYSGGNVDEAGDRLSAQTGGGATVVADSETGSILVVAGGGGGGGDMSTSCDQAHRGGNGGQGGSWTGGNGNPYPGGGGEAGANGSTEGQASTSADDCAGGAGGGGVQGGLAGSDGNGAGGGAGSSAAPGLDSATISAVANSGNLENGLVVISSAS